MGRGGFKGRMSRKGACSTAGEIKNANKMLIRKLEGKRTCGKRKCEREDNKYYNDS
jgi:hypothetical protein